VSALPAKGKIKSVNNSFEIGPVHVGDGQLFLVAGPCVIESEAHARKMAEAIQRITSDLGIPYIFKASYDKANRTSVKSYRGRRHAQPGPHGPRHRPAGADRRA
jgi:3-deoxy-D-manno-octulosonic acid (KDO) 8-phosphate synthase